LACWKYYRSGLEAQKEKQRKGNMTAINFNEKANFIWSVADLLRGPYRPNQYKDVMLPLTVLRRLDCVLEPTKARVLVEQKELKGKGQGILDAKLVRITGVPFYNTSKFTFEKLRGDPTNIAANLVNYMKGFSDKARTILDSFGFEEHIGKLDKADRLFLVVSKFAEIDLHPARVSNIEMGYVFEELIRRFNEASNEEAGDHFTPREVIRLMVDILFNPDSDTLTAKGIVKTMYDCAMGTGGMLSVSQEYLHEHNPDARLEAFGQDYNSQSYAISGSDMMIKGQNIDHIVFGDSFTADGFPDKQFDYMLANPPFGVEWKPEQKEIEKEYEEKGFAGRFGAGLPRINDGSFLFLQHMISKMKKPEDGGTRLGIVFNGSPLFTGGAGSGESEIRRWIIENDWLEAIIAMPDQLFYNTGISTYIWIVSIRKEAKRKGKVQLIDATTFFSKMRKSLGNKRNEIDDKHREEIVNIYASFRQGKNCKIYPNSFFGYNRITVERPLKLNFIVNEERLERVKSVSQFVSLAESKKRKDTKGAAVEIEEGRKLQETIITALQSVSKAGLVKNDDTFIAFLDEAFKKFDLNLKTPLYRAIMDALSERDETADVITDSSGNPVPDSELRDNENVPLDEKIDTYMKREVLPYVPDAWIDEDKTKVGYEISFNRYFYIYQPPRSVEEIQSDLTAIEDEIAALLTAGLKK
jgi:type I restriction enzyme M protein